MKTTIYNSIVHRTHIEKGWSGDQKYCATTADGCKYLLRISSLERLERKEREFEKMREVAALGIPMCLPIEFGVCEEGAYSIQSWIEGKDAEEVIPALSPSMQYAYGFEAGKQLRRIHVIPAPSEVDSWDIRYDRKIDAKIKQYHECPLKYENGDFLLDLINKNRHLICGRPSVYQHGDFHRGNIMIGHTGQIYIIDFDRDDYGDPWQDMCAITWDVELSPAFASGRVDGYFDNNVPMEFWRLLMLYVSVGLLSSLPWAIPFGQEEIGIARHNVVKFTEWYDSMRTVIPNWYQPQ